MVVENNAVRLREIKSVIMEDNNISENIQTVSISTTDIVVEVTMVATVSNASGIGKAFMK